MNPKRYSQIERALQILDKSGTVGILKEDQYLLFLFKKTERVIAALYIITGLFSDTEPLKWATRESGTILLKHTLSFKERAAVHSKECLSDTLSELAYLLSLLDLAYVADLISPMNLSVIKRELETVSSILEGKWRISNAPISQPFFEDSFFGVAKDIFLSPKETKNESSTLAPPSSLEQKDGGELFLRSFGEFERFKRSQKDISKGQGNVSDNVLDEKLIGGGATKTRLHSPRKSVAHSGGGQVKQERKQHIFSILRQKNTAMIKDFSAVITNCSEKTVQRLLIDMVRSGVLKREGDRRWSRYSILEKKEVV